MVHGAGFADDVFFDHQATHVVGPEEQRDLSDLLALCDPRGLNVRHVVEEQPSDGLGFEVLERTGGRKLGHVGAAFATVLRIPTEPRRDMRRLVRPANERRETAGFVLQFSNTAQMLDAFGECFHVSEHHCGRRFSTELMPHAIDVQPIFGERFSSCDGLANAVDKNLATTTRNATESGVFEPLQHGLQRKFGELHKVMNLRRAEGVEIHLRKTFFD